MSGGRARARIVVAVAVVLLVQGWLFTTLLWSAKWNDWVNEVRIAAQPGSTETLVNRILGRPDYVYGPREVFGRFMPKLETQTPVKKVYAYTGFFPRHGGCWVAYILLDDSGRVVGMYTIHS